MRSNIALNDPNFHFLFNFLFNLTVLRSELLRKKEHLIRPIRYTDKAIGCNLHTKIKTLITENNSGIINPLIESLTSDTSGNFADCSYFISPLQGSKKITSQPE